MSYELLAPLEKNFTAIPLNETNVGELYNFLVPHNNHELMLFEPADFTFLYDIFGMGTHQWVSKKTLTLNTVKKILMALSCFVLILKHLTYRLAVWLKIYQPVFML